MSGGDEVRAAGHLAQDDVGIARNVLAEVTGHELRGDREAAREPRADDDGDGLAFVEIGLRLRGRRGDRNNQQAEKDSENPSHRFPPVFCWDAYICRRTCCISSIAWRERASGRCEIARSRCSGRCGGIRIYSPTLRYLFIASNTCGG